MPKAVDLGLTKYIEDEERRRRAPQSPANPKRVAARPKRKKVKAHKVSGLKAFFTKKRRSRSKIRLF